MPSGSRACALAACLALSVSACGDDDSSPQTASPAPSGATGVVPATTGATGTTGTTATTPAKRRYVARADAICRAFDADLDKATARARTLIAEGTPESLVGGADAITASLDRTDRAVSRLKALSAPAADQANVRTYLILVQQRLAVARLSARGLRRGNIPALEQLQRAEEDLKSRTERAADAVGFRSCGRK